MKPSSEYRADINGLRAVAVLSVFLFHLNPNWLPGGFLGVDVFFVISGYLITGIIVRENLNGSFSFSHFYARRIRRIFPALFVVLILSAVVAILLLTPETYVNYMKSSRYAAAQLSNFFFAREVSYFEEGFSEQPLLHTWTLGVEEQFYLFWPLLIFLCFWFFMGKKFISARESGETSAAHFITIKVAIVFSILSLISFFAGYYYAEVNHNIAFYMFYTRAWEFGLGGLLALNLLPKAKTELTNNITGILGILLLGYSFIFVSQDYLGTSFLRFGVILPVIGSILILYSIPQLSISNKLLAKWLPVSIGLISYSLYLYHEPIIIFYKIFSNKHELDIPAYLSIISISFILSVLSYRLVEQPIRKQTGTDRRVLIYGVLLIIVFSASFKVLEKSAESPWRITTYSNDTTVLNKQLRLPKICKSRSKNSTQILYCNVSVNENSPVIALLGDSHGQRFVRSVVSWAKENSYNVITINVPGCPMLLGNVHIKSKLDPNHETSCSNALPLLKSEILSNPEVKLILLAQRFDLLVDGKTFNDTVKQISFVDADGKLISEHSEYYRQKLTYTINKFKDAGKHPIILRQIPLMSNVKSCNWKPLIYRMLNVRRDCNFDTDFIDRWQRPAVDFIDQFIDENNLYSINLVPYLDSPVQNGVNLYLNIDHLNEQGSQFIVPYFKKELNKIMEDIQNKQHPVSSIQKKPIY